MDYRDATYRRLAQHVDDFWTDNAKQAFGWTLGRVGEVLSGFSVIRVAPTVEGDPWIYLSHGAWEVDSGRPYRMEFVLLSPTETARHIESLAMLATYHSERHVDLGSVIGIGREWLEGSQCGHFLVSLPYPLGPQFETCRVSDDLLVRYLWVLPITASEANFARARGYEALEERFDEQQIEAIDPQRPSVV